MINATVFGSRKKSLNIDTEFLELENSFINLNESTTHTYNFISS